MLSKISEQALLRCHPLRPVLVRLSASYSIDEGKTVKLDSVSAAYGYKSRAELFRGWLVFKLCSYTFLVNRLTTLLDVSRNILGRRVFENVMRSTLYGHFVAGTDQVELKPIVGRLHQHGVKLILDYCMESDIGSGGGAKTHSLLSHPANEDVYDENLLKSLRNVQTAAELCGSSAITAIKITAFVSPDVLQKLNQIIEQDLAASQLSIADLLLRTSSMNKSEASQVTHLLQRIDRIIQEVDKHHGKIFIDAEQSYFQTAIHKLVLELQERYNRERLIVYNTYQCYRTATLDSIRRDLTQSKEKNFYIGLKLVRGAYMDQERKRALETNGIDPIHRDFAATTECYHRAFTEILEHRKTHDKSHVIVASHNEKTVQFALKTMDSMNVKRDDGLVSFATLFGMCDYLTFPLAAVGYDAYKLAPYGPINRLLPYLTRRAQENRAIFAKAEKDRRLHYEALKERVRSAQG